jgi:hypothetical protein
MSSSEPSENGTAPAVTSMSRLRDRIHELESELQIAQLDLEKEREEHEQHLEELARAEYKLPRPSGRQVDAEPGSLIAVFRHSGRECATQKRLARLRERLPAWLARYRLELAGLEEVE